MKRRTGILVALFLLGSLGTAAEENSSPQSQKRAVSVEASPPLWTEDPDPAPRPRRARPRERSAAPRLFWQVDFWTGNDAFEEDEEAARRFSASLLSIGYDAAQGSVQNSGGLGLRFGLLFPTMTGWDIGGSAGYVAGPTQDVTVIALSRAAGDGMLVEEAETDFYRFLFEAQKEVPLSRWVGLRLRGGAGWAAGKMRVRDQYTGTFVSLLGYPASAEYVNGWGGFTWEVMPSFVFRGNWANFEVGLGWAGFPKMEETDDLNEFAWNPLGFRLGLEFR